MSPQIHRSYRTVSASSLLETIGATLGHIRDQYSATWADMGQVLGKSGDRAAAYAGGFGDMGVISFIRGCGQWNGRFANPVLALVGMKLSPIVPKNICDRRFATMLSRLKLAVDEALENDDLIDDAELDAMQAILREVGEAIDARRTGGRALIGSAA